MTKLRFYADNLIQKCGELACSFYSILLWFLCRQFAFLMCQAQRSPGHFSSDREQRVTELRRENPNNESEKLDKKITFQFKIKLKGYSLLTPSPVSASASAAFPSSARTFTTWSSGRSLSVTSVVII